MDRQLVAMNRILAILKKLSQPEQERIVEFVQHAVKMPPPPSILTRNPQPSAPMDLPGESAADSSTDPSVKQDAFGF